jgi:hypothetical protein
MIASRSPERPSGRSPVHSETTGQRAISYGYRTGRPGGAQTTCAADNLAGGAKPATPAAAEPPAPSVPAAQVERIRTWVKYGMTVRQVAEHDGAEIDEIRRIIRTA